MPGEYFTDIFTIINGFRRIFRTSAVEKNRDRIQNESLKPYYAAWYEELLKLSKEYQKEILDKQQS